MLVGKRDITHGLPPLSTSIDRGPRGGFNDIEIIPARRRRGTYLVTALVLRKIDILK
jgi:hypothetical protein